MERIDSKGSNGAAWAGYLEKTKQPYWRLLSSGRKHDAVKMSRSVAGKNKNGRERSCERKGKKNNSVKYRGMIVSKSI